MLFCVFDDSFARSPAFDAARSAEDDERGRTDLLLVPVVYRMLDVVSAGCLIEDGAPHAFDMDAF